jgi:hypothetical protein
MSYKTSPSFLVATVAGASFCATFSSLCYTISYLTVPSLLLPAPKATDKYNPKSSPGHIARQWQFVYDVGKMTGPPVSICSAGSLLYAMTRIPVEFRMQRQLYIAAAVCVVSIMPFTLIALAPTNSKLIKAAEIEKMGQEVEETHPGNVASKGESTQDLVRKWAGLNAVRGIPPLIGIGCVVAALVM